jgi:hypothetical protein
MKNLYLIFLLLFSICSNSQEEEEEDSVPPPIREEVRTDVPESQQIKILNKVRVQDGLVLIGILNPYSSKTTEKYNFYIDDLSVLEEVSKKIKLGELLNETYGGDSFLNIRALDKGYYGSNTGSWHVSIEKSAVMINGEVFRVDLNYIEELAKKYPLFYQVDLKKFANTKDYMEYMNKIFRSKEYLFDDGRYIYKYDGSFDIDVAIDEKFKDLNTIYNYLREECRKFDKYVEAQIEYSEKVVPGKTKYWTFTISSSRDLYDNIKLEHRKGNWRNSIDEEIKFFMKK